MRRWKLLLAGAPGAGKSTLCRTLLRKTEAVIKTQSPAYHGDAIVDLPGEYLTVPHLRLAFLASVQDVSTVLYLLAADETPPSIPAGLLQTMPGLTLVGVISKVDAPGADIERSRSHLKHLGLPEPYFEICCLEEESAAPLRHWLNLQQPESIPAHEEKYCETDGDNSGKHYRGA